MNCRSAESLFSALLDDELSQAERRSLESHLLGCRRCSLSLREFKGTMAFLGDAAATPAPETSPHFEDDLMARIRSGEAMRPTVVEWLQDLLAPARLRPVLFAGAAACALFVAVLLVRPGPDTNLASSSSTGATAGTDIAAAPSTDGAPAADATSNELAAPPRAEIPAAPERLAAATTPAPDAAAPATSTTGSAMRPLRRASDAVGANGVIEVVDRYVPGSRTELDSTLPNPNSLFKDEYVTDQFYLKRGGTLQGSPQPTAVPVSDRGSDDVYIEF